MCPIRVYLCRSRRIDEGRNSVSHWAASIAEDVLARERALGADKLQRNNDMRDDRFCSEGQKKSLAIDHVALRVPNRGNRIGDPATLPTPIKRNKGSLV